jgi:hypothetical protein
MSMKIHEILPKKSFLSTHSKQQLCTNHRLINYISSAENVVMGMRENKKKLYCNKSAKLENIGKF